MNTSTFEKKIEIEFWFEDTEELKNLSFEERELLEAEAIESIFWFITREGYTAGELYESINDEDFNGWWNYKIINK